MKTNSNIFEYIKDKGYKTVLVTGHMRPDIDAFFSSMAMVSYLRTIGVDAYYGLEDLPLTKLLSPFIEKHNSDYILDIRDGIEKDIDFIVILDTSVLDRVPEKIKSLSNSVAFSVIDHHSDYKDKGSVNYIDEKCASTGMLVYRQIKDHLKGLDLKLEIAEYIYLTILGDTGGFANSNTDKSVFDVSSELITYGIKPNILYRKLFARVSIEKLKFLSYIYQRIDFMHSKKVAYVSFDLDQLEKYNLDKGDIEGIAETLVRIENVKVGLFIKIENGEIKVSLRSVPGVDIRNVAVKYGGGGHKQAAGMSYDGTLNELLKIFEKELESIV